MLSFGSGIQNTGIYSTKVVYSRKEGATEPKDTFLFCEDSGSHIQSDGPAEKSAKWLVLAKSQTELHNECCLASE